MPALAPLNSANAHVLSGELVLGIDGGGSNTVAIVARAAEEDGDQTIEVLGRALGGPSNHVAVGRDRAMRSLDETIDGAFRAAGVRRGAVAAACLGLAGADRAPDREMFTQWANTNRVAARVRIENDGELVLAAGTPDGWGLAIIAGTGSFALARAADGRTRRSGGWGYLLGDEGSGFAIALDGLRAVARAADGRGPDTQLTDAFLARLGVASPSALIAAIYSDKVGRAEIAALADVVTRAATHGDATAQHILMQAALELTNLALAAHRLFRDDRIGCVPLTLAGGVFASCEQLCDDLVVNLLAQGVHPSPVEFVAEPALGAIRLARNALQCDA
jgi:N-acetylglucosamine kinase-like BadF-type ATPase